MERFLAGLRLVLHDKKTQVQPCAAEHRADRVAESALASLPPAERDLRLQIVFEQNAASNEELRRRLASADT